ncbi:MAG: glycoside hydrolase family 2 TIM barrel-domain containing protein [Ignavibacteria bacterium]
MRIFVISFVCFLCCCPILAAKQDSIALRSNNEQHTLVVNGQEFFIKGMNWDYFPTGTNYSYSLWKQPDATIKAALDYEMGLLKNMGVNVIRQYTGIPSRWISYIHERFGIYTVLNHTFGRYGLTVNNAWVPNIDYANAEIQSILLKEVVEMVSQYKNTPGLLMYLLGNENNYGLFWRGAETENIPVEDRQSTKDAVHMYRLFNNAVQEMKTVDSKHPIAVCNGDLLFLDIIAKECRDVDVLGINVYRGISFDNAFERVSKEYGKPLMFTEFGADAFNTQTNAEDQESQAKYLVGNWKEIYANAARNGKAGNSIGGFTFQFSDGWWKYGQTSNLDVHDINASWSNGGYQNDYVAGENNMNEEWFGICAKGKVNDQGLYVLYPRAAYYALKELHSYDPYGTSADAIQSKVNESTIIQSMLAANADKSAREQSKNAIYLSDLQANFTTFSTGGSLISTGQSKITNPTAYPRRLGFDHMQSFNVGVTAKPAPNVTANVQFNILGNVAENPIDEVFYENRGRPITINNPNGTQQNIVNDRIQLYKSSLSWNSTYMNLTGFYRTGHYHWGYEGDFFGLYPEANYGPNIDIYSANTPFGFEIEGKKFLKGLKVAFGPELWWGANPAVLVKYSTTLYNTDITGMFQEDLMQRDNVQSSFAVPVPKTRKAALNLQKKFDNVGISIGGLWGGQPLNGRPFQLIRGDVNNYAVYEDTIRSTDNFGGKIKVTYESSLFNWYALGSYMGLVANGGYDNTKTFTGWRLKDIGSGNMMNFLSGFTMNVGTLQIAPNMLWQKPLEGPIPSWVQAPARPRNILDDPFSVRSNRETIAGELLLTYDPTPATWMYEWDNDRAEDATFAASVDLMYRHLPTTQDAAIGILSNGRTTFVFPGAAPAQDLWEVTTRIVSKINPELGFILNLYAGNGQANGSDTRTIQRFGADLRTIYKQSTLILF